MATQHQALIEAYLAGRIGRREMVRGLAAVGVTALGLRAWLSPPMPAGAGRRRKPTTTAPTAAAVAIPPLVVRAIPAAARAAAARVGPAVAYRWRRGRCQWRHRHRRGRW